MDPGMFLGSGERMISHFVCYCNSFIIGFNNNNNNKAGKALAILLISLNGKGWREDHLNVEVTF